MKRSIEQLISLSLFSCHYIITREREGERERESQKESARETQIDREGKIDRERRNRDLETVKKEKETKYPFFYPIVSPIAAFLPSTYMFYQFLFLI